MALGCGKRAQWDGRYRDVVVTSLAKEGLKGRASTIHGKVYYYSTPSWFQPSFPRICLELQRSALDPGRLDKNTCADKYSAFDDCFNLVLPAKSQ